MGERERERERKRESMSERERERERERAESERARECESEGEGERAMDMCIRQPQNILSSQRSLNGIPTLVSLLDELSKANAYRTNTIKHSPTNFTRTLHTVHT